MTTYSTLHTRLSSWFAVPVYEHVQRRVRVAESVYKLFGEEESKAWAQISPMNQAFLALAAAREELDTDEVQVVGEDLGLANNAKRYAICLWGPLYHHLRRQPPDTRHIYACVMEGHNRWGICLVIDIDGKYDDEARKHVFPSRAEVLRDVARMLEVIGLPCIIDDACSRDGSKQSLHIVCRRMAFRTSEEQRQYIKEVLLPVCPWVDTHIPNRNGLFKLVGCTKKEVGKRGQRPNPQLLYDLPPLTGTERYEDIVTLQEFQDRRPWLSHDEAARAVWPRQDRLNPLPPRFLLGPLEQHYVGWDWDARQREWGMIQTLHYLDYWHTKTEAVRGLPLLRDSRAWPLVSAHIVPDSQWLVAETLRTPCECHEVCERCWATARSMVERVRATVPIEQVRVVYTGFANVLQLWFCPTTHQELFVFAAPGVRQLLRRLLPDLHPASFRAEATWRMPGCVNELSGSPSFVVEPPLPLTPPHPAHETHA